MSGRLSKQYKNLARLLGTENMLKMVDAFGGRMLYVPKARELAEGTELDTLPKSLQQIAKAIGLDGAAILCKEYENDRLYVPMSTNLKSVKRQEKIRQEYDGTNISVLAKKYRISERWVSQLVSMK